MMTHLERFEAENCYQSITECHPANPFRCAFVRRWERESVSWSGLLSPTAANARQWGYALASNWLFSVLCERANLPDMSVANFRTRETSLLRGMTNWIDDDDAIRAGFQDGLRETWFPVWRRIHAALEQKVTGEHSTR